MTELTSEDVRNVISVALYRNYEYDFRALCRAYPEVTISKGQSYRAGNCSGGTRDFMRALNLPDAGTLAELLAACEGAEAGSDYRARRVVEYRESRITTAVRHAVTTHLVRKVGRKVRKLWATQQQERPVESWREFVAKVAAII